MLQLPGAPKIQIPDQSVGLLPAGVAVIPGINTCQKCGNRKIRAKGLIEGHCPQCKTYWCLKNNCPQEYNRTYINHRKQHLDSTALNECCHCGAAKVRGTWIRKQCDNCHAYWCNFNDTCKFESRVRSYAIRHQQTAHHL